MSGVIKTVLVSGALGTVGQPLCELLESKGHTVRRLSRGSGGDVRWDVEAGTIDAHAMDGVDVVVHLAGERVAQRWTAASKARMLNSRVGGAELLVRAMLDQPTPPEYITSSGTNYYGCQPGAGQTEASPLGDGFLASVCEQWEGAAQPLVDAGVRVVYARTGMVLSARAGALSKMLTPFKAGVGGVIGNGGQHISWVSLPDIANILCLAIEDSTVRGPLNVVAPQAVTNQVFTDTLGSVLNRPTFLPMPEMVVRALFGAMGMELLCSDVGVVPQVLLDRGYQWEYSDLHSCFQACVDGKF